VLLYNTLKSSFPSDYFIKKMLPFSAMIRLIFVYLICASCKVSRICSNQVDTRLRIKIMNDAGHSIDVFWINPNTGESIPAMNSLPNGESRIINTFIGHNFEMRELPSENSELCNEGDCKIGYLTVRESKGKLMPRLWFIFDKRKLFMSESIFSTQRISCFGGYDIIIKGKEERFR